MDDPGDIDEPAREEGVKSRGIGHVHSSTASVPCSEQQAIPGTDKPLTGGLAQPWRAHWPPAPGSELEHQIRERFPQVFEWEFHPDRLFEHPWRNWTFKTIGSTCNSETTGSPFASLGVTQADSKARPKLQKTTTTHQEKRRLADSILHSLPRVTSDFRYLAPLPQYKQEKLYKLQLPCLDFGQTNLESEQYPVTVFDLSGKEHLFTLADAGFRYSRCPVPIPTGSMVDSEAETEAAYLPALCDWLKDDLDCEEVLPFAYNVSHTS